MEIKLPNGRLLSKPDDMALGNGVHVVYGYDGEVSHVELLSDADPEPPAWFTFEELERVVESLKIARFYLPLEKKL